MTDPYRPWPASKYERHLSAFNLTHEEKEQLVGFLHRLAEEVIAGEWEDRDKSGKFSLHLAFRDAIMVR